MKPDVWPNCDLKLTAFEKILAGPQGVDSNQPNYVNICTCLDILSFLLTILRKEQVCIEWTTFSLGMTFTLLDLEPCHRCCPPSGRFRSRSPYA